VTPLVEFDVLGTPMPQGSKKAFMARGRAMMKESSPGHASWRNAVADKARDTRDAIAWGGPFDGALALTIEFRFKMPASRPKAAREAGRCHKTTAPDVDKLVRAVGDGLQASGIITDDARFCVIHATKVEVNDWTGARIGISRVA
jgi:Holliday junction resolvase RusA-like endonuclease